MRVSETDVQEIILALMLSWLHQIGHAFFAIFITSNKCFLFQTIDFSKTKMLMWCFFSCESINCTNRDAKNLISQLGEIHQSFLYKSLFSMYFWIKAVIKFYVSRNINCSNFSDMHNCFFFLVESDPNLSFEQCSSNQNDLTTNIF